MFQLKLPVEISTIIEISDPVYTFCEVMDSIDLRKYLAAPESKTGRKRYNSEILLKVTVFSFIWLCVSAIAQSESENISGNVRWGILKRMENGTYFPKWICSVTAEIRLQKRYILSLKRPMLFRRNEHTSNRQRA